MLTLALCLSLGHAELPASKPMAVEPSWSERRAGRVLGALLGGALGLVPGLIAAGAPPSCAAGLCGTPTALLVLAFTGPALATAGATLGSLLFGGEASVGASIAGLGAGLLTGGLFLLVSILAASGATNEPTWPALIGAAAVTVAGQTVAMELRNETLHDDARRTVSAARFGLTTLGTLLAIVLSAPILGALATNPVALLIGAAVIAAGAPLIPWGIHRALGGQGSALSAYLGLGAGVVAVGIGVLFTASAAPRLNDARWAGVLAWGLGAALVGGLFSIPLALEFSHGLTIPDRPRISVMPVPGGLMAGVGMTF